MDSMVILYSSLFLFIGLYFLSIKYINFAIDASKEVLFALGSLALIVMFDHSHLPTIIFPMYLFSISNKFRNKWLKYLFLPAAILPFAEYYLYISTSYNAYLFTLNYLTCIPLGIVVINNIQTSFKKDLTTYLFVLCAFLISGYWNVIGSYLALATVGLYTVVGIVEYTTTRNAEDAPDYIYLDRRSK